MNARDILGGLAAATSRGDLAAIDALGSNERLNESFRRLTTAFPDVHVELEWTVEEGARVVGWAHITGTHGGVWRDLQPAHRPIDVHGMIALELTDDGAVKDFWLVNDWLGIATQLGVRLELPAR